MRYISVRGARTHNLKNIDINLPRDKFIVITGLSGSGKSSLAFDTLYAEGQRRYVESLSSYARQFLSIMEKPDVDLIEGLSPAISIEQKTVSHNPRSTVGTITEIYDYLRLLFARVGIPRCPKHGISLEAQTVSQMVDAIVSLPLETKVVLLSPIVRARKGEYKELFHDLRKQGFIRARVDGNIVELEPMPALDLHRKHTIEAVIDRVKVRPDLHQRLAESFELALRLSDGIAIALISKEGEKQGEEMLFSSKFACPECGYSLTSLEPRLFSFNNPIGACQACDGLGTKQLFDHEKIIRDASLSLQDGAIRGWDKNYSYNFSMLSSLAKHYQFDLEKPFNELPKNIRDLVLYGGDEKISFSSRIFRRKHAFEGVIPSMERRYRETDSLAVKEEFAKYLSSSVCPECEGARLQIAARNVFVAGKTLPEISAMTVVQSLDFFKDLKLPGARGEISSKILKEICCRLSFLVDVGLTYISLSRNAETLSGGEAQRIRLASQIGSRLMGVMYILDEPTIGLHQRDNKRLLQTLLKLKELGNTVIVVEHDADTILSADYIVDMGKGAGIHGGSVVFQGSARDILKDKESLTGKYLSGEMKIDIPEEIVPYDRAKAIVLKGVRQNNLKNINVEIPVGLFTCITGVSGSGKSSLIKDVLYKASALRLNKADITEPKTYDSISGLDFFDKVIAIDQNPIGRTPRSNPATYTGILTFIRELFASTQESRVRGYKAGRFSFNVQGGRCEACQGDGVIKVEMHFLPDVYVTCDVCQGKRYNRETLDVRYKGKNIHDVLSMTVEEAGDFFASIPILAHKLKILTEVGLSYICLGQSSTTLSGGESQRIKLSRELSKKDTGNTIYILDEPTTGLHFHDIKQLLGVLHKLRDRGNTVIVIEHNLDVIKTADWIVDLGPEGGDMGGRIIACGTPLNVSKNRDSYTGMFLKGLLKG